MSATVTETQREAFRDPKPAAIPLAHLRRVPTPGEAPVQAEAEEAGPGPGDVPPPVETEKWNKPLGNVGRLAFAFWAFAIAGLTDGVVGALIPYLEAYYDLSYTVVSLIFLTPFVGYATAAFTNARIHMHFGQRGVAVMAPVCHIITYLVLALHPPYPVLVVANAVSGFGNGMLDACFSSWASSMERPNTIQGFLHSSYSIGALFAPLVATSMMVNSGLPWYTFYYMMIGAAVLELIGLTLFFWHKTAAAYRASHVQDESSEGVGTKEAMKYKVTWLCSLYFFAYMGVEVGLGGWIVTFMLRVRRASAYASGVSGTGFWAGQALGRAVLGFVTERFGERRCILAYLAACIGLELLFWLASQFIVSAVAVAFLGFFLGPMFPGAVMVTAKLLPKRIHVSAIGFAMAMGGTGGTVFPFIIGAVSGARGMQVLPPIILALTVVVAAVWISFPRIRKRD